MQRTRSARYACAHFEAVRFSHRPRATNERHVSSAGSERISKPNDVFAQTQPGCSDPPMLANDHLALVWPSADCCVVPSRTISCQVSRRASRRHSAPAQGHNFVRLPFGLSLFPQHSACWLSRTWVSRNTLAEFPTPRRPHKGPLRVDSQHAPKAYVCVVVGQSPPSRRRRRRRRRRDLQDRVVATIPRNQHWEFLVGRGWIGAILLRPVRLQRRNTMRVWHLRLAHAGHFYANSCRRDY